jgi:hypothetical protein
MGFIASHSTVSSPQTAGDYHQVIKKKKKPMAS